MSAGHCNKKMFKSVAIPIFQYLWLLRGVKKHTIGKYVIIASTDENGESHFLEGSKLYQLHLCERLQLFFFLSSIRRFVVFSQQNFLELNLRATKGAVLSPLSRTSINSVIFSQQILFPLLSCRKCSNCQGNLRIKNQELDLQEFIALYTDVCLQVSKSQHMQRRMFIVSLFVIINWK